MRVKVGAVERLAAPIGRRPRGLAVEEEQATIQRVPDLADELRTRSRLSWPWLGWRCEINCEKIETHGSKTLGGWIEALRASEKMLRRAGLCWIGRDDLAMDVEGDTKADFAGGSRGVLRMALG
jgi:hypothetical protein